MHVDRQYLTKMGRAAPDVTLDRFGRTFWMASYVNLFCLVLRVPVRTR